MGYRPFSAKNISALIGILILILTGNNVVAQQALYSRVASGNWTDGDSWSTVAGGAGPSCSCTPTAVDDVTIEAGQTITMDGNPGAANSITINGTAHWATTNYITDIGGGGITIAASGNITGAVDGLLRTTGSATINATLTSNTVYIGFQTTAAQTVSGTSSVGRFYVYSGVNVTNTGSLTVRNLISGPGTLTNGAGATLTVSGTNAITTLDASTNTPNTVIYNTTLSSQTIKATNYYNLTLDNSSVKYFASGTTGIANVLTINNGSVNATNNFSTISFNGSGAQTIPSSFTYYNLTINKSGGSTASLTGTTTVNNTLTISNGVLDGSSRTLQLYGNWSNSSTFTASTSTIQFRGSSAQSITGATTFNNLTVNNTSGVTLNNNITIGGTLTFTAGNITTGANNVIVSSGASVSRTSGHVVGNMRKSITAASPSKTFEIGSGSNYTPVSVTFTGVTVDGILTASTTAGDHPNIGTSSFTATETVNRYWTLTNGAITFTDYSATFNFVAGDVDGGVNTNFMEGEIWGGASWTATATGTRTSTSTQLTTLTSFGDFQLGEIIAPQTLYSIATGNWTNGNTWSTSSGGPACSCTPSSVDDVIIEGGYTITMDGNSGEANSINITNGTAHWASTNYITEIGAGGITIGAAGNITGTVDGLLRTTGSATINATLTSNTVYIGFQTTAAQTISGTSSMGRFYVYSGVNVTNTGSLTVRNLISGPGTLTNGAGATLTVSGTNSITTLDASTNTPNTVIYNTTSSSQTIKATNYYNLTLDNSSVKYFTSGTTGIANALTINNGSVNATNNSSTISYNGPGAQTVRNSFTYYNLTLANAGTKTFSSGTTTVNGNLTVSGTAVGDGTTNSTTVSFAGTNQTVGPMNYHNLTFNNNGTKIFASGTASIANTFTTGSATIDATTNDATINYSRGGNQSVPGLTYHGLTISGSGTKTLAAAASLQGTLTVSAGTFDMAGLSFTISSTGAGAGTSGQIAQLVGSLSNATNVTYQRRIPAGAAGDRQMAVPITGRTVNDWSDDFTINYPPSFWGNVTTYNPLTSNYDQVPNSGTALTVGKGYDAYIYSGDVASDLTVDVTGTVNTGSTGLSITQGGDSYNMVGNPYPCDIDWEDTDWTKTNIGAEISVWDYTIDDFRYYTAGVGAGSPAGSRYIASGQAFFVQTTGGGAALTAAEGVKAPGLATFYSKTDNSLQDALTLRLSGNKKTTGAAIRFLENGDEEFNPYLDGRKLTSPVKETPYLATLSFDHIPLNSNVLPPITGEVSIPVIAKSFIGGTFTMGLDNIPASVPSDMNILLEDKATGRWTNLRSGSYSFTLAPASENEPARFVLHITRKTAPVASPVASSDVLKAFVNDRNVELVFNLEESTPVNITLRNMLGQVILEDNQPVKDHRLSYPVPMETQGVLFVTVKVNEEVITKKLALIK